MRWALSCNRKASGIAASQWHNLKLRFSGSSITGFVDKIQILTSSDTTFSEGMTGLVAGSKNKTNNTAMFDNLLIKPLQGIPPGPTVFQKKFILCINRLFLILQQGCQIIINYEKHLLSIAFLTVVAMPPLPLVVIKILKLQCMSVRMRFRKWTVCSGLKSME